MRLSPPSSVGPLERYGRLVSSRLAVVEVGRQARRLGDPYPRHARRVLSGMDLIDLTDAILEAAADLDPVLLRSLDAIHLATALALGAAVDVVVTYDHRMQDAARLLGLRVAAPA